MSETSPTASPIEQELQTDKPGLKRPRPVLSCLECRRKKLRCDRNLPCQQCRRNGRSNVCAYQSGQEPLRAPWVSESPTKRQRSDVGRSDNSATNVIDALQARVERLEHELGSKDTEPSPQSGQKDNVHLVAEDIIAGCGIASLDQDAPYRRLPLLTRFPDAKRFLKDIQNNVNDPEFSSMAQGLQTVHSTMKALHKVKEQRITMSSPEAYQLMLGMLPSRQVCDVLIDLYFKNFEHCTRILVRPCFMEQYEQFWQERDHLKDNVTNPFLPSLVGALSVASSLGIAPECGNTSLHGNSDQPGAVALMRNWVEGLPFKKRDSLAALQVRLMTMLPQRSRHARTEDLWSQSAQLVRHALLLSLHREPATIAQISFLEAETRRRLWYTVLEQDFGLSILSNMPYFVPNYTTKPPLNVNDEDLKCGSNKVPTYCPTKEWTDNLCQHVLATTLLDRLAAYSLLCNEKSSYTRYGDIVNCSQRLEGMLRDLPRGLRFGADNDPGRLLARMDFDIHLRRLLLSIYSTTATATQDDDKYLDIKKAFTQSSLVLLCYQDLFDPRFVAPEDGRSSIEGYWDFYYNTYRNEINQSAVALCFEIQRLSRNVSSTTITVGSRINQSAHHEAGFPGNALPQSWTRSSMIKTMDETLEPMVRRITRYGASMKDLAGLWICSSLVQRPSLSYEVKSTALRGDLRAMLAGCKAQFEREGIPLLAPHTKAECEAMKELGVGGSESSLTPLDFDILLQDFLDPSFDLGWENGSHLFNSSVTTDVL